MYNLFLSFLLLFAAIPFNSKEPHNSSKIGGGCAGPYIEMDSIRICCRLYIEEGFFTYNEGDSLKFKFGVDQSCGEEVGYVQIIVGDTVVYENLYHQTSVLEITLPALEGTWEVQFNNDLTYETELEATFDIILNPIPIAPAGIKEARLSNKTTIYPNPSTSIINIDSDMILDKVEFYNSLGQKMDEVHSGSNKLTYDHSRWPEGVYFIRIHTETGTEFRKLIFK